MNRMNTKNLMVSFVAIAMALFLVATVSALNITKVTIDGIEYNAGADNPAVIAGETITVKVYFTAETNKTASDVTVKVELGDNTAETEEFVIVEDNKYKKVLNIKVPYDFEDDELSTELDFKVEITSKDLDAEDIVEGTLTIQKPKYNIDFKSINVDKNVEAGETFPVDIVLRNTGYNDLDDLFVTARISALDIEERFYFGDLFAIEDGDDEDTLHKRFKLTVPYGALTGAYTLEVEVSNEDTVLSKTVTVEITNKFPELVIKSGDSLILVNPTDSLVGYKIIPQSPASVSEDVVLVDAGSSETVTITPNAQGEYSFDVSVFSMDGKLISTVTFTGSEEVSTLASPIVVLTVILAIIFLVLLVVLIVLVTKKPEKAEEFGESYY